MSINAGNDIVKHYGNSGTVTITNIAGDSYHLFGGANQILLSSGKVEVEDGSFVGSISTTGGAVVVKGVVATPVTGSATVTGTGTNGLDVNSVIEVGNADTLINLAMAQSTGVFGDVALNISLTANIDLTNRQIVPFGSNDYPFHGSIDGGNRAINGFSLSGNGTWTTDTQVTGSTTHITGPVTGFIAKANGGDVSVSNLTFTNVNINVENGSNVGTVIGFAGEGQSNIAVTLTNVHVTSGSIYGKNHVGGLIGKSYGQGQLTLTNCSNAASVSSSSAAGYTGGLIAIASKTDAINTPTKVSLTNCTNSGSVSTAGTLPVGGLIGRVTQNGDSSTCVIEDCSNTGTLTGNTTGDYIGVAVIQNGGTTPNYPGKIGTIG